MASTPVGGSENSLPEKFGLRARFHLFKVEKAWS